MSPTPSSTSKPRRAPASQDVRRLNTSERLVVFALYLVIVTVFHGGLTGEWTPTGGVRSLWFLSAVALLAFRLLSAPLFVRPTDAIAASITAAFMLWAADLGSLYGILPWVEAFKWASVGVFILIIVAGVAANTWKDADVTEHPGRFLLRAIGYRFSVTVGAGEVVFTPTAIISIAFHGQGSLGVAGALIAGWLVVTVVAPLERTWRVVKEIRAAKETAELSPFSGRILRIDSPDLIRVSLTSSASWGPDVQAAKLADGTTVFVLPLFTQVQEGGLMGTGLCAPASGHELPTITAGHVHELKSAPARSELIKRMTKLEADAELVGFIVEDSRIGTIRFEVAGTASLAEGHVVFCRQGDVPVFYQLLDAYTTEESFDRNPHGTRVVTAAQLGSPDKARGFSWYPWVPEMNTPVFLPAERLAMEADESEPEGFQVGLIPGTDLTIRAEFELMARYHTAVLGTTGMGKTEFVFDLIREGVQCGAKIICIDFTGEYMPRLDDLGPVPLGLPKNAPERIAELTEAVETGKFGGAEEKRALLNYLAEARPAVQAEVDAFLREPGGSVGIFELEDIANTRATLRATEMLMSEVFSWARNNRQARRILLTLEEAHTIIPEINFYGYDKSETSAVVGRMSQIALQGRKYGVGLLLVSQRTALVSKTVLSQCNTVFSFALVDRTSLDYLQNVYSSEHVVLLPNLRPRQMVAFGKGVRTDRPVVVEIPFDPAKQQAAEALGVEASALEGESGEVQA